MHHAHFIMLMALLTLALLQGRRQFDDVLRHLCQNQTQLWQEVGSPPGYFWRPEARLGTWLDGTRARSRCFWSWLARTPPSLTTDDYVSRKLVWIRINTAISHIGLLATGIGLVLASIN